MYTQLNGGLGLVGKPGVSLEGPQEGFWTRSVLGTRYLLLGTKMRVLLELGTRTELLRVILVYSNTRNIGEYVFLQCEYIFCFESDQHCLPIRNPPQTLLSPPFGALTRS